MTERVLETERDRQMLIAYISQQALPLTVSVEKGRKRSTEQNRLQRQWVNEIAEQLPDRSAEEWRGYCKLHFGVPIMRNASAGFCETYDEVIRPLPYEQKIKLMMAPLDMPVTRLMTAKQKTQYLDDIVRHFTEQGVVLTDPDELGRAA